MMHCSFYLHQPSEIAVYYTLYIRERLISTARSSLMTPFEENRAAHRVANQFRTLTKTRVCFFPDKLSRWCGKSSGCVTYTYRDITYKSRSHDQTLKRSDSENIFLVIHAGFVLWTRNDSSKILLKCFFLLLHIYVRTQDRYYRSVKLSPTSTRPFFLGLPISEETLDSYYVISIDHVESSRRCLVTKKYRCEPRKYFFLLSYRIVLSI